MSSRDGKKITVPISILEDFAKQLTARKFRVKFPKSLNEIGIVISVKLPKTRILIII